MMKKKKCFAVLLVFVCLITTLYLPEHTQAGNTSPTNWYYWCVGDTSLKAAVGPGDVQVLCVGTNKELSAVTGISYDTTTDVITLNGFDDEHLSVYKEGVTVKLVGKNYIRNVNDCLCVDANFTLQAEPGALLDCVAIADSSVDPTYFKTISLGTGVVRTGNSFNRAAAATPTPVAPTPTVATTASSVPVASASLNSGTIVTPGNEEKDLTTTTTKTAVTKVTYKKVVYQLLDANTKKAAVIGVSKKSITSITIAKKVKIGGITCTVTEIAKDAFKNCKKLKKITIQATTISKIGKNACKGIAKRAQIKVPKSMLKKYKKLFKGKGITNKMKFVK